LESFVWDAGGCIRSADYLVLGAAGIALTVSIYLWFGGSRDEGLFVVIARLPASREETTQPSSPEQRAS
jgi:hypothetical protein